MSCACVCQLDDHRAVVPRLSSLSDTHEASVNDAMETQYNYMRYIGRKMMLPALSKRVRCAPVAGHRCRPKSCPAFRKEEKRKKGADATTNRTAVGQSLASNHACPLGDICGFGFGLAEVKSLMTVRTAVFVCA